ncbi:esterase [Streptomyces camponoticapitis]|uniref:Esterase n=1 Tax=Streptomyces camponoticapitis TaxID=1616125 RepID=A0ABQ2E4K4_9ACTN|nr:alpha/beta hydrolase [Streptomyces camponoticapitis]GGJ91795.1 esterase [Streptomyces camponoticapitis]
MIYVLVSGAWHGGWCWGRVAPLLRAAGHEVHTPTLTGVSDRAHLLGPHIGLSTHVEDVVRLLDTYDLTDVRLVGHSYGGQVVAGVAERRPERLAARIHLDGFVPEDGDAAIDLLPPQVATHYRESVRDAGFGWLIPPRSLATLGVTDEADVAWLTPRLTPHPWATYLEPVRVGAKAASVPGRYIDCTDWLGVFAPFADRARALGWDVRRLATGHEAMVTAPEQLAALLVDEGEEIAHEGKEGDGS